MIDNDRAARNGLCAALFCLASVFMTACTGDTAHNVEAVSSGLRPSAEALPVATGAYPMYGHAPDYSWVAGRLNRRLPGAVCVYIVFYPRPGGPWGGRLPLNGFVKLDSYPNGDMIVVHGDLNAMPPGTCGTNAYAVKSIEEH